MKKYKLILFFYLLISLNSNGQIADWIKINGGSAYDNATSIKTVGEYLYISGYFGDTILINSEIFIAKGYDYFLAKYKNDGELIWFKQIKNSDKNNLGYADIEVGNNSVYIVGVFFDTLNVENINLISNGISDIFIIKYDSVGEFEWAKKFGGESIDQASETCIDSLNNLYFTGTFGGQAFFEDTTLNSIGSTDIFLTKISNSGKMQWIKQFGSDSYDYSASIEKTEDHLFILIGVSNNCFIESVIIENNYEYNGMLLRFDTNGNYNWYKLIASNSSYINMNDLKIDNEKNLLISGVFNETIILENDIFDTYGENDIFFVKYSFDGTKQFAKQIGGNTNDFVNAITSDSNGNIYIAGDFNDTCFFDSTFISANYNTDIFIACYNSIGILRKVKKIGSAFESDQCNDISIDKNDNLFLTGCFYGEGNNMIDNSVVSINGSSDFYLAKINKNVFINTSEINNYNDFEIYPNPCRNSFFVLNNSNIQSMKLYNSIGAKIYYYKKNDIKNEINISELDNGIYFLEIEYDNKLITKKIIKN